MTGPALVVRRPGVDVRTGTGDAFGTFGELLQGALPDGTEFLVTLPIRRYSRAWFRFDPAGPLRVFPSHKLKSLRLAGAMLAAYGLAAGGTLVLDTGLPVGKGLASSSADLVATARAIGGVLGLDTSSAAVEGWIRPIEPTDGVMHRGIVVFEHRAVRLRSALGVLPAATVVAVDEGGRLDTLAFNSRPKHYSDAATAEYALLLQSLTEAVQSTDLAAVGKIATRSAILNQRLAPKRNLRAGALGVVCAHSGTMLGLLFAQDDTRHEQRLSAALDASALLPGATTVFRTLTFPDEEHAHAA